ncbi:MAG: RusA family crossover junction endodeoxyribonuclease [Bacillota bacterium]|nr:RusA family crossover junction endodeoxyribonuclease [Bacillota bacterium]
METKYAKIIVQGSPISKSNFKLFNFNGRAILPYNSGKYHDRYALYEQEIAYFAKSQNPNTLLNEALIAVLKVYYKSKKRHPDTNNITKSIFDGIEKSGLIVNDAQIRKLIIEEFYDSINPRFELELFAESSYYINYSIKERTEKEEPIIYSPPSNSKKSSLILKSPNKNVETTDNLRCAICNKAIKNENAVSANNGKILFCKDCFEKLF